MSTELLETINKVSQLSDRLDVTIYFGYNFVSKNKWRVEMTYRDKGLEVKSSSSTEDFGFSFMDAWNKLEKLLNPSIPGALAPAISPSLLAADDNIHG